MNPNICQILVLMYCGAVFFSKVIAATDVNCTNYHLKCKNGECIASEQFCDGVKDCSDGSDEIPESCIYLKCPQFAFQCAYGACINGDFKCDNIQNCADNSDENSVLCGYRHKFPSNSHCLTNQFQCNHGSCIPIERTCDGKNDCLDSSDETVDLCAGHYCQTFAFRCGYGACVNGAAKCNGVIDCLDGSDEVAVLCKRSLINHTLANNENPIITTTETLTTATPAPSAILCRNDCVINDHKDLIIRLEATNKTIARGQYVKEFQGILYGCPSKTFLEGPVRNYCIGGKWATAQHPTCIKYCPSEAIIGKTFQTYCRYHGVVISCSDYIRPGTIAEISCLIGYRKPNRIVNEFLRCDEYGEWDYSPFRCEPVCGTIEIESYPFVMGGSKINNTIAPWHVGIYSTMISGQHEQICGGTIINAKLVLSAAHCFWDAKEDRLFNHTYFNVAAGKYFRNYTAIEPLQVQFFNVSEIHIPNGYQDVLLSYQNDIALLILNEFIEFKLYVKPICTEWYKYSDTFVSSGQIGHVAGWGKIGTNESSSDVLQMIELQTVSNSDCMTQAGYKCRSMIVGDKFCVSSSTGEGLCGGDSGGGFVIPKIIDGIKTYFLQGVLSYGLTSLRECESQQHLITFTNIQFHSLMVQSFEAKYRPK